MLSASKNTTASVIDAVKLSGFDPARAGFNEHVFYDYPTVGKVVDAIVADFSKADPSHAATFAKRGTVLRTDLDKLEREQLDLQSHTVGVDVAITEPVPDYVLNALGMTIVTPTAFSEAIENGTDVPAAVLEQTLATFSSGTGQAARLQRADRPAPRRMRCSPPRRRRAFPRCRSPRRSRRVWTTSPGRQGVLADHRAGSWDRAVPTAAGAFAARRRAHPWWPRAVERAGPRRGSR